MAVISKEVEMNGKEDAQITNLNWQVKATYTYLLLKIRYSLDSIYVNFCNIFFHEFLIPTTQ